MSLPIEYLSLRVTEKIQSLPSLGVKEEIKRGLNPLIEYNDSIKCIGEISAEGSVTISKPFCQFFWVLCNIALRIHDSASVSREFQKMNKTQQAAFLKFLEIDSYGTLYFKQVINWEDNLKIVSELGDAIQDILSGKMDEDAIKANPYITDLISPLGTITNSLYCYGIAFIALHEFSHFSLGHDLNMDGTVQEEKDADANAFWTLYCDLSGPEKHTAMMGVICVLAAMMFINPKLEKDGIHPQENERLHTFYDLVFSEEQKESYRQMLIMVLTTWAVCFEIKDFPKVSELGATQECLDAMWKYLQHRAEKAPSDNSRIFKV